MEVTCEQCKAEYDFDEALLGEKGTTVKCSGCGHVFRVHPRPQEDAHRSALQLRFADTGEVIPLASLRELQKRISAGEVTRDDELGREGFPFRRLGEVPELKNFFGAGPGSAAPDGPKRTVMGLGPVGGNPGQRPPGADTLPPPNPKLAAMAATSAPPPPGPRLRVHPDDEPARAPTSGIPTRPAAQGTLHEEALAHSAPTRPGAIALALDPELAANERPDAPFADDEPTIARAGFATEELLGRPGALAQAMTNAGVAAPQAPATGPVQLRVGDEAPERERAAAGSKLPLAIGVAVLLAGGAAAFKWFGAARQVASVPALEAADGGAADRLAPDAAVLSDNALVPGHDAGAAAVPDAGTSLMAALPAPEKPAPEKPAPEKPAPEKPAPEKPAPEKPAPEKPAPEKPNATGSKPGSPADKPAPQAASSDYGSLVARGDQLFAKGDLQGAREAYTAAVGVRPSGSEGNSGLGFVLLAQGQLREALPVLNRAAANGYMEASIGLGDVHRKLGNTEDAIEAYGTYLARMPNGPRARYAQAQIEALGNAAPKKPAAERPAAAPPRETETPQNAPSNDYRPAGEMEAPAPAPTDEPTQ
jgi:predicted Zn finger-like uncharacterized protein